MSKPPRDDRTRIAPSSNHSHPANGPAPGDFGVGEVIGGSYKVLAFIGRGGMGAVYRVQHLYLDKELALKTLSGNQITTVAWRRFQIEGQAIARLDHPNIIRIYDLGITGQNQPYYVMDVIDGVSLKQLIKEQGALKPGFALPIFRQVSAGLAYAHDRGIIHRDLKPGNIMLMQGAKAAATSATTRPVPITTAKILDFGLAKLTDLAGGGASGLTKTGEIFGSPLYMSPEQAQGLRIDQTTDIYSFGCTIFEALTGEPPLKGANAIETMLMHQSKVPPRLAQVRPDLEFSEELEIMVAKLLAKKPKDRIGSFADIASKLLRMERPQDMSMSSLPDYSTKRGISLGKRDQSESVGQSHSTGEFTNPPTAAITTRPWFWPTLLAGSALFLLVLGSSAYNYFVPKVRLGYKVSAQRQAQPTEAATNARTPALTETPAGQSNPDSKATGEIKTAEGAGPGGGKGGKNGEDGINQSPSDDIRVQLSDDHPFSHIEGVGSGRVRVFDFPKVCSLGKIYFNLTEQKSLEEAAKWHRNHGKEDRDPYTHDFEAQGKQKFALTESLVFEPTEELCSTPLVFKRFGADDLFGLDFRHTESVDSDFLPYIKHLRGLASLNLTDTEVDDRAIKVLDSLTGLRYLYISRTRINGEALAKSALIKRIKSLSWQNGRNVGKLLQAIDGFANIEYLSLDFDDLTTQDLQVFARLPNLHKLCINNCTVGDGGVKILTTSKSVTELEICDKTITPKSIAALASMNLRILEISGLGWTDADCAKLTAAMAPKGCKTKIKEREN